MKTQEMKAQGIKQRILLLCAFFFPLCYSSAQNPFVQAYGSFQSEEGRTVHQTSDGGYIISGVTNGFGVGGYDMYMIKIDSAGNVQWSKTFGGTNDEHKPGKLPDIQITKDGGYFITGHTKSFLNPLYPNVPYNFYYVKTDSMGNPQWSFADGYTDDIECNAVRNTMDGGYVFTGGKDSPLDLYIWKIDSTGGYNYVSGYQVGGFPQNDAANDIIETQNGTYIAVGYKEGLLSNPLKSGIYMIKVDMPPFVSTFLWNKVFYEANASTTKASASSIIITKDGNYVIAGSYEKTPSNPNMFIMKTDTSGNILWFRLYSPNQKLNSLKQTNDGGYVVAGTTTYTPSDVFMMKTDSFGNVQWAKSYGGQNNTNDEGYSVEQTKDGGYVIGGTYGNFNKDVYIIKTDSLGNNNCVNGNLTITGIPHSPSVTSPSQYECCGIEGLFTGTINSTANTAGHLNCHCYFITATAFSDTLICAGGMATLSAASSPVNGYSYSWSTGATSSSIIVSPTNTTTYSVAVVDSNACVANDNVTVMVYYVNANASGGTNLCIGGSTSLSATGGVSYSWTTGATSSAINVVPSTTTTYSVFVTDATGCIDTASVTVLVYPYPVVSATNATICAGQSATLNASSNPSGNYSWSTGSSAPTTIVNPNTTTTYTVIASIWQCNDTATGTVTVLPIPTANAGNNVTIDYGNSTTLVASGGGNYYWNIGSTSDSVLVLPTQTATYILIVTDANGCTDVDSVTVYVTLKCPLYLPNAFSPNDDNENDSLQLFYNPFCVKSASIVIYNRWGEIVFESNDKDFKWEGTFNNKELDTQVFVYHLKVSYWEYAGENVTIKGNVSLIR